MSTVWLVRYWTDYEGYEVKGIFVSKELAEAFVEADTSDDKRFADKVTVDEWVIRQSLTDSPTSPDKTAAAADSSPEAK